MIRLTVTLAALTLAACNAPPPETGAPAADAAGPAPSSGPAGVPVSAADKLTAQGFGAIRVGQTLAEVESAYGAPATPIANAEECAVFHPARAPAGVFVMIEGGKVSRVTLRDGSTAETDRALNIGDTAAEVKRVYGGQAISAPAKYDPAPAEDILVWAPGVATDAYVTDPAARGVRYEIGRDGKVRAIHGGGPSIQLAESCG